MCPIALLVATSTLSCGHGTVRYNGREMPYEEAASAIYQEGKDAQRDGDTTTAKTRYRDVIEIFADSRKYPDAVAELAYILFEEGGCTAARNYLEQLAADFPLHHRGKQAKEKLAECDGQGTVDAPITTFDKVKRRFGL